MHEVNKVSVLLIDEFEIFRESLEVLFKMGTEVQVVGSASRAADGIEIAIRERPDVLLTEMLLPDQSGLWLIKTVRRQLGYLPILVVSLEGDRNTVVSALRAGANGYLHKDVDLKTLTTAVVSLAKGQSFLDPVTTSVVVKALAELPAEELVLLSRRETEVLRAASSGYNNNQIAESLELSIGTVKAHLRTIFRKLNVESRTQAVTKALDLGLLKP